MILILSSTEDVHATTVQSMLRRRGRSTCLFDPGRFPHRCELTVRGGNSGLSTTLIAEDMRLDLSEVTSAWYRRPQRFDLPDSLLPEERAWTRLECVRTFDALWRNTRACWVSPPEAIRVAGLKLVQLRLAAELGLRIPRFLVTNRPQDALDFIRSLPCGAVVKALGTPAFVYGDQYTVMIYTHRVVPEDLKHLKLVSNGPTLLQEFLNKDLDVRVTVIGSQLFAVGIDTRGFEEGRTDFRRADVYDLPHQVLTLPHSVHAACLAMVRELGLRFGAIDLLLTPDGEYIFLEINPNGQWIWLEWVTGLPLVRTMCDLLCGELPEAPGQSDAHPGRPDVPRGIDGSFDHRRAGSPHEAGSDSPITVSRGPLLKGLERCCQDQGSLLG